jgi:hypothetical protein
MNHQQQQLSLSMPIRDYEDRDKHRHRGRQQNEHAQIHVPGESTVARKRPAAHRALSKRRVRKDQSAKRRNDYDNENANKVSSCHKNNPPVNRLNLPTRHRERFRP